ncbi:MAG: Holliday junction branch migration protein RuvA [Armatimonadetes bacterium]|uniref:Holliday junction branch migration complex subunit RuvA n=1 Tax=Candidatus Nitrosymbiomonas proteolyticus TaxID=2608984 RepID=A0A809S477_9BACT|nr:Holliday junction branch migration protein RuvA [Armatimonadota bacterium]MCK6631406.1 Holliday junction branch migration protein RuvA [Fimbriimonadaceae bacterium]BBO23426.1 Holliday junction DNA helicase subunit RuvA [Candidatus Nitrosymbiomonas proteolyticus]NOG37985.1 Holliday junction branch migration protein RuvA [Armatimonadota bacterium]NUM39891.1 Holliday junction branch migration protein RuvA [Armatimonadota bacterium]
MIGRLRGELAEVEGSTVIVDVAGVGYQVTLPEYVAAMLPPLGDEVVFRIRQVVREDSNTLYGFLDAEQLRLFDLLCEVKGCGPRLAMSLIGQLGEETVAQAILGQDARVLVRASGVGLKLAERILLELKDKVREESFLRRAGQVQRAAARTPESDTLVDALVALGYRRPDAESVAREVRGQAETVEEQLKLALRQLSK